MTFDLAAWRSWCGLSQAELATLSGLSSVTISALEGSKQQPSAATLQALARAFGVTRSELLHLSPAEMWQRGWRPPVPEFPRVAMGAGGAADEQAAS